MVWAILARMDGETVTGASWQDAARSWAVARGVSDGTDPNGLVTREQFATMLLRYAGEPASAQSLSAFTDAASVSGWAGTAMAWAVEKGIVTGVTATTLVPQGTATPRAGGGDAHALRGAVKDNVKTANAARDKPGRRFCAYYRPLNTNPKPPALGLKGVAKERADDVFFAAGIKRRRSKADFAPTWSG